MGCNLALAEQLADDILEYIADLHDQQEKEQEQRIFSDVVRDIENQQGRRITQAIHTDHQRPMDFRVATEEFSCVLRQRRYQRQRDEHVDWNEDRKHPVPVHPEQEVLDGNRDEEGDEERRVIARLGQRQRDNFSLSPL